MTKTLNYKIISYYGDIIKIIAYVEDIIFLSSETDPLSIDVLVNNNSILSSSQTIELNDDEPVLLELNYRVKPKDKVKITYTVPDGTEFENLEVKLICSK